jgi:hypothetical protein
MDEARDMGAYNQKTRRTMRKLNPTERDHMTRLIMDEVDFFRGLSVDPAMLDMACSEAALKVEKYLLRKFKGSP